MNFFDMFKNLMNQDKNKLEDENITVDKIIASDDFDDTFIAAFGGFK